MIGRSVATFTPGVISAERWRYTDRKGPNADLIQGLQCLFETKMTTILISNSIFLTVTENICVDAMNF